ncbi:MAG: hypothetical protein LAO51_01445 [Acidobacteriia bacterium]|nr:hypothetical protein [Terriglobia bacterium]
MNRTTRVLTVGGLLLALAQGLAMAQAQEQEKTEPPSKAVYVSEPVIPTLTPAVRDLPDWKPDPSLFGLEMKRRDDYGFIPFPYPIEPRVDPLLELNRLEGGLHADGFDALVHNYAGQTSSASPPDTNGDVGLSHFVQSVNQNVSTVRVLDKATGAILKTFTMQSLTTASPCRNGFCDPVVLYDRMADRWLITELPSSTGNVCVYMSTSGDPTGTWYAYSFPVESGLTDYPKYGVWPQNGNGGSYLMGANAGSGSRDIFAFDRAKMLAGQPATFQKFSVANLPNSGFQIVLPSTVQGSNPPPDGEPAIFMRPRDDEAQTGANTPSYDLLEMWALSVDWGTPSNSTLTPLPAIHISDYDMTLCGMGGVWDCMPQPGTSQKIDPIREPLHFPLQYRNFLGRQTLVGNFPEDVDGTDHSAVRWFEVRKTGSGAWGLYQEGVIGGEPGVHRSMGSIAMDGSGDIAIGYTRTGGTAPYYPSIYYKGRLSTDPLGTMPQGEFAIQDATTSKTNNNRWGDYAAMAVDPVDDCTFWFTTEYGGSGATRVAAMRFDGCGCLATPAAPAVSVTAPQDNRIDVSFTDSDTATITQYLVYRSTVSGGPYALIATVPDSSPGVADGPSYTYHDDTVSGGSWYYYLVRSNDGGPCTSAVQSEASAQATGQCLLAPSFTGLATVDNPGNTTCTLNLSWSPATSVCSGSATYNVYRSTTQGFVPAPANRIATGVSGTTYADAIDIASGTTYYYVVRAVESVNGAEDTNTTQKNDWPTGPFSVTSWTDMFEGPQSGGGFDQPGWTHFIFNGSTNWAWSTSQKHDGSHSWYAADVATRSEKVLVSPAFGVGTGTTLTFFHTYAFDGSRTDCFDGATLEYLIAGAGSWTVFPTADFTSGVYTGTINPNFSNPIGGAPGWCGGTIGPMGQVAVNLSGDPDLADKTIQVRWHEGDDSTTASSGWYVDTVSVANARTAATCFTGIICTAPGAPTLTAATGNCAGVSLSWDAGSGSTVAYDLFRGTAAGGPYTKLNGLPMTGTSYTDATAVGGTPYYYVLRGACDLGGVTESGYGNELSATAIAEGGACSDGNACTQTDTCHNGGCVGANPVICPAPDPCHDAGTCVTGTGICSNPAKPNGTACDDGILCTDGDTCQAGTCVGGPLIPPPVDTTAFQFDSDAYMSWYPVDLTTGYDVVRGSLAALRSGGFAAATSVCLAQEIPDTFLYDFDLPAVGTGYWILVRAYSPCGLGTYDDMSPSQAGSRDAAIAASPNACP